MAITFGARTGVALWSSEDDHPQRADFQTSHQAVEDKMAVDVQGTLAARPAPTVRGRYYWATDDRGGRLYRDDGVTWTDLGPSPGEGPLAGGFTARITGHAAALTSDPVLLVRGKTGQTGDLLRLTDPTGASTVAKVAADGALSAFAGATVRPATTGAVGLVVDGLAAQTADLVSARVNGAVKLNITAGGLLNVTGGITLAGSPSGYAGTGEIQGVGGIALTTTSAASPTIFSDHRGAANTGTWVWRNGTSAGSTRMNLDAAGNLVVNGNLTAGAGGVSGQSISIAGGSLTGRVLYQDPSFVYMGAIDVARPVTVRANGADVLLLTSAAASSVAVVRGPSGLTGALLVADVAGTQKLVVGSTGGIQATGDDHYFGRGALGAAGDRVHLSAGATGSGSTLLAENQAGTAQPFTVYVGGGFTVTMFGVAVMMALNSGNPPASGTAMTLRVNSPTTGLSQAAITLGAADSGGAGFRALRVPN